MRGSFRNVSFSPNIFTPYPGIPIWPQLRELGVHEPQSLVEWMEMPLGANMLPWLKGKELARLKRMLEYFLLNSQINRQQSNSDSPLAGQRALVVRAPIRWRLRSSRYSLSLGALACALSERSVSGVHSSPAGTA